MRQCLSMFIVAGVALCLPWFVVSARVTASLNLKEMTAKSDLICVGEITSVRENNREFIEVDGTPTESVRFGTSFHVFRVIKGEYRETELSFTFVMPLTREYVGYVPLRVGQFGMFFLRKENGYTILNSTYPFILTTREAPNGQFQGDLDRVVGEVAHVLSSTQTSSEERGQAIYLLDSVHTPAAMEALRLAVEDPNRSVGIYAAAALLRQNDIGVLGRAVELLLHPPSPAPAHIRIGGQLARGNLIPSYLAMAIFDGVRDPKAVDDLARLLSAPDAESRRGAAHALRKTRVTAAVEPLSQALEDSDAEVQYETIMGLAEITGQDEWVVSFEVFQVDREKYLSHWRKRPKR